MLRSLARLTPEAVDCGKVARNRLLAYAEPSGDLLLGKAAPVGQKCDPIPPPA